MILFTHFLKNKLSLVLICILISAFGFTQTYTFTNAGASGNTGPTQGQVNTAYTATSLAGSVTINTQGIQEWTVPVTGNYSIRAIGGTAGNFGELTASVSNPADMYGEFFLTAGQVIKVLVGQHGFQGSTRPGWGGGGGSFVTTIANSPLIIAGGAGATHTSQTTQFANTRTASIVNAGKMAFPDGAAAGWADGCASVSNLGGGSGAGFNCNGTVGNGAVYLPVAPFAHSVPLSFINGGVGDNLGGGFGGGGGCTNTYGGCGGGYTGGGYPISGGYSVYGAGGSSFNIGINQLNQLASNNEFVEAHGVVIITSLCSATTLTPDAALTDATGMCSVTPATPTATDDCGTTVNGVPDVAFPITTTGTTVVTWTYTSGSVTTTQTQNVIVSAPALQTVVPLDQEICPNTSANIQINSSQVGVDYFLRDDSDNSIVDGPIVGTGSPVIFNTGNIATTTDYNVIGSVGGSSNGSLTFDGINDNINVGNQALLNFTNTSAFSIEANVNWQGAGQYCVIASKMQLSNPFPGYEFRIENDGRIRFDLTGNWSSNDLFVLTTTNLVVDGLEHHIAATYDGSSSASGVTIYIDGVAQPLTIVYDNLVFYGGNALPTLIGSNAGGAYSFNGEISDVRFWSVERTALEIANNMSICLTGNEANLIALYPLNEAAGLLANDAGTNGFNGTLTNMAGTEWNPNQGNCIGDCATQMSAVVTVTVDATAPIAVCQDITVVLDATGNATIVAGDIDGGSTDFCPTTLSIPNALGSDQFDCTTVGANIVTLTVTDDNGNTATCDATVTVEDNEFPTVTCNNVTVVLDGSGNGSITTNDIGGLTAADNCGIASVSASTTSFTCANVGANTVTLTVTDDNGNVTTCDAIVTVEDNTLPNAICQPATVVLDAAGNGSIIVADIDNGSNDNCGIASMSLDNTNFTCANIGANTVVLTVTDDNANVSTCSSTVTVQDNTDPIAICQDITVQLDVFGVGVITPAQIDNVSNDACGIANLALDNTIFGCGNVGANTVELTVTDNNANTSTCNATVTVEDNVAPAAICQPVTVQLDASGNGSILVSDINNGSNDACGILSLALDITTFDCSNVGANTVILTVTDNNSNVSTCSAIVTVEDNIDPIAICQDVTVQLDPAGMASITTGDIDNVSNDACGIANLALDITNFSCADVGVNAVVLTVTDNNGNTSTCGANVTVQDTQAPMVVCPSDITLNAVLNNCGRVVTYSMVAVDNCSFTVTQTDGTGYTTGDLFPVGTTIQSYNITDQFGNTTLCSFNVTIVDNQNPSITGCPANITANTQTGVCQSTVSWIQPTASDNCPGVVFTSSHGPGSVFALGTTTVTYTATDASGNTNTCTFDVTVQDNQSPIFVDCPADISITNDPGLCEAATLLGSPTVTDNCTVASVLPSFTGPFPVGTTVVTWTATDGSGNTSTCVQNVNVTDDENPLVACTDITIQLDVLGDASIVAGDINGGASDNCGIATITASQTAFDCSHVGANTVTLTVVDIYGNSSSCDATVTVEDNVDPIALCQSITVQLDASGDATITTAQIDNGSNDACGIAGLSLDITTFDCSNIGANAVVLTVTDNNGNTSTCGATVTVEDNVAPDAVCQDITVQLNAAGNASIVATDIDGGSSDACGILSYAADITNFTCADLGGNAVVLTVTDLYGNSSTCTSTVTVEDNVAPVADCQDITVQLDATGNVSIAGSDVNGASTDACGPLTFTVVPNAFTCAEVGVNTVELTVTDGSGNTSTCNAVVTVEDNVAPVVTCNDITVELDASGNATIIPDDILNATTSGYIVDQTGVFGPIVGAGTPVVLSDDQTSGALPIGFNFDFFGTNYSNFYISSNGFLAFTPEINGCCTGQLLPDATSPNNLIAFAWEDINPGAGGSIDYFTTGVAPNRQLVVNFTNVPHFGSGNQITVQTVLNETSNAIEIHSTNMPSDGGNHTQGIEDLTGTVAYTTPGRNQSNWSTSNDYVAFIPVAASGATDACGIASTSVDISSFDCTNVGPNSVVVTATDVNGNSSTCTSTVTVEDNIAPVAICQDVTVQLDAAGSASIVSTDIDNGSNDACGIASVTVSPSTFDCADLGANTVTLTVTDNNGNVSTCTATVTVEDVIDPTITCPGDIAVVNDPGVCEAIVTFADPITADNCPGASISLIQNTDFTINGGLACWGSSPSTTRTVRYYDLASEGITTDFDVTAIDFAVYAASLPTQPVTVNLYAVASYPLPLASMPAPIYTEVVNVPISADMTLFNYTLSGVGTIPAGMNLVYELVTSGNPGTPGLIGGNDGFGAANETDLSYLWGDCVSTTDYQTYGSVGFPNWAPIMSIFGSSNLDLTQTAGLPSGSAYPVGTTTNTFVVTDGSGNTATCSFDVVVTDTEAPIAVCNTITVQLDATGNASITVADIDGGSTDNCTIATTAIDVTTFDCSNVGPNTVILTVEDIYGNTSTCASTVTVEDNVAPVAICQDVTVQLDAAGLGSITTLDVDNGSNDACGIASLGLDITNFSCADVGTNTVILTVIDNNSNSTTCTSTVTVEDNVAPIAICQDITAQLDVTGNVSIVPGDIDNGSSDACGIASITLDIMDFDCSNVGANTVILTVEDNNGNTTTCTSTVTVEDNVAPMAICQDITAQLDATGNVSITPMDIDNGSSDACGIASITLDVMDFDCSNIGANTVILTVTDVNGNSTTCSSTVTVEDNIAPIITCPADITVSADPGVCDASFVAFGMATAVDNCTLTMTFANNAPAVFPLGNTTVTWTATDAYGNSSSCDQIVTVIDSENPVITCPADVVVSNTAGACSATVAIGAATATDNCGTVTITSDATGTYPVGVTNVTWTATDDAGNTSICVQTITVNDTEAPTIAACASDVTVNTNPGGCFATGVALGSPSATDNCTIASVTNDGLLSYPLGTTVVTWTVTDLAGNTSTCTQNVTVEDNELPMIFCPANQTVAADLGTCTNSTLALGTPLVSDNCTASPTVINNAPAVYPLGVTTVTWTVTDASGNSATCNQIITVIDNQNPTIACGGPITISADLGSCVSTMVVLSSPATFDNCGVASTSNNAPATFPLGNTAVIWTVTDNAGNTATCTQMVTVEDNEAPTITCPADVTIGTAGGACDVSFVALGTPTTADNCTVASTTNNAPVTYPLGTTVVTWTVTDAAGNTATCAQNVTVIDNEAPQINCPADIVIPADAGVCVATGVAIGTATGSDNCTLASIVSDAPAAFPLGLTTITWTATDAAGNTATCTQTVNVIDNQLPTITCPSDVTITADAGVCDATGVVLGSPITADNCSVASVTSNAPATFVLGTTTVTWTVVDGSGNSATCNQLVTVTDNELPMIACSADITIGTITGTCQGSTTLITPVTSDNCSVASVVNDAPGFYNIGTTAVTWTVTDGSGNTATCVQTVTVEDTEAPTIFCPADMTVSTDPGMCEAVVAIGSPIVNDNCNIASVTNDEPATFPIGTTVVTWTIVDDFGNSATCTQTITVEDNEAPLIVCPGDITVTNVPGNCGRNVSYALPTYMDNCNVTAMTQTDGTLLTSGSWFPIGTTLQEYTVVDQAGNSFSCSFNVIVVDNEMPLISNCPADITVYSTATTCDVLVNYGTPVISDNCFGATYTASHFSGDMFPVGLTTVTYTAMDNSGNTAGCSFNITVFDTISPVAPVLASVQGGCSVTLPTPTTTDNCSGTLSGTTSTVFPVTATGITAVTWTFTDASGNTTNVDQYISIDGVVDATVSYSNDVTLISNNTTPGATYQWIDCNTSLPLPGATNISYVAPINGSYAVQVTEPGCAPVTSICYTINSVGLDDVTIEDLVIYPNPSLDGKFTIKFEGTIEKVDVIDMLGRIITVPMAYDNKYVDGSELANGKYMLRIYTANSVTTKEVIIVNK